MRYEPDAFELIEKEIVRKINVDVQIQSHYFVKGLMIRDLHIGVDDSPWSPGYAARILVFNDLWTVDRRPGILT